MSGNKTEHQARYCRNGREDFWVGVEYQPNSWSSFVIAYILGFKHVSMLWVVTKYFSLG